MDVEQKKIRGNRHERQKRKKCQQVISLVGSTQYLSLSQQTSLNYRTLSLLTDPEFDQLIYKMASDFNILLHFKKEDFWKELQNSESLRKSLESCLKCLSKRSYNFIQSQKSAKYSKTVADEEINVVSELTRIVLFIYHRIAFESQETERQIIYDKWIMDIPKMLLLIETYQETNFTIVQEIIEKILTIDEFKQDFEDFLCIIDENVIPLMQNYINSCNPQKQDNRDPIKMQDSIKTLIPFYDTFRHIIAIYDIFPQKYSHKLASHIDIHSSLIYCINRFLAILDLWTIENSQVQGLIKLIEQNILKYTAKQLKMLKQVIKMKYNNYIGRQALQIYELFCTELVSQKKNSYFYTLAELLTKSKIYFFIDDQSFEEYRNGFKVNKKIVTLAHLYEKMIKKTEKNKQIQLQIPKLLEWRPKQYKKRKVKYVGKVKDEEYEDEPEYMEERQYFLNRDIEQL